MNKAEPLCDLRFVKVEYRLARPAEEAPENSFDISIRPLVGGRQTFSVAEKNGEQFAESARVLMLKKPSNKAWEQESSPDLQARRESARLRAPHG